MLRKNQLRAINKSLENNFESGIHFHATGTGKSWISLELCLKYIERYPNKNILWLCEQKSILIEQFNRENIKKNNYGILYKKFMILDYSSKKPKNWMSNINMCSYWKKPMLIIINRAFLVSQKKYEKIKVNIDLIIHDECHSIVNKTTQTFYEKMKEKNPNIKCIGFSATPVTTIDPFKKIISYYSIYDAYQDNVIVAPRIIWTKCKEKITYNDILKLLLLNIDKLYYKKIIVWCGMIKLCYELAERWKPHFKNYIISTDTSVNKSKQLYNDFDAFKNCEKRGILFCASKHREGSDIKNLDCCLFIDKVENRNAKTFVQCIGRVLRKDKNNKKKAGLIIDVKAKSCIKICDRINKYLNCNRNIFPWKYKYEKKIVNNKKIIVNEIKLKKKTFKRKIKIIKPKEISTLRNLFTRKVRPEEKYQKRLNYELNMIEEKNLTKYLVRAMDILKLAGNIPHITRGSCGSSYVCYLLGISHIDPIEKNIKFERFLNNYRSTLPDIDFDFPHNMRDEIFLKLQLKWPGKVARISNHVHWHEKSATREAIRRLGYNKQIPKDEVKTFIKKLSKTKQEKIKTISKELENTFRTYSLHCGGIIFFPDKVPEELIYEKSEKNILSQVIYDKRDVSKSSIFKIDILSSRGLSQLNQIYNYKNINFDLQEKPNDIGLKAFELLCSGQNIGITLAESPLMRKAMLKVQPKCLDDIALCLAIIRPAAKDARLESGNIDYKTKFIYDDDAINIIANYLKCDYQLADAYRRGLTKNNKKVINQIKKHIKKNNLSMSYLENSLKNLRSYSFCKSHAYSYAQLVYKLACAKVEYPKKFWLATLDNCNSYYRKWVHYYEACLSGIDIIKYVEGKKDNSIYACNRTKKFYGLSKEEQLRKYGYWVMTKNTFFPNTYFYKKNNLYLFGGIFAHTRMINYGKKNRALACLVGVGPGKYIDLIVKGNFYFKPNYIGIKGRAILTNVDEKTYEAKFYKFY